MVTQRRNDAKKAIRGGLNLIEVKIMTDETRNEIEKHFDEILNLLDGENDDRLKPAFDAVKECGELVSEILDKIQD